MKIGLIVNFEKSNSKDIAKDIIGILDSDEIKFLTDKETSSFIENTEVSEDIFKDSDILITIGGDGTIIHNAKKAALYNKAVLGVNSGRIGYLAGLDYKDLKEITALIHKNYIIEERIMLDVIYESEGKSKKYIAFNDAVISKGNLSRMIDIDLGIENNNIKYRADGLIFATPTGSTAYSMSAGGPMVHPLVENIVITPICPYSYFTKSIVIPANTEAIISVDANMNKEAYLTIDGEIAIKINNDDKVHIKQSSTKVKLINIKSDSIYNYLERKNK